MSDAEAARVLAEGRLVILPTETVYGLAADAGNAVAVAAIFEAKGRPRFNPLIAHVADAVQAEAVAVFDARARALAEAFWPGPLTIVAPVRDRDRVCDLARAGLDSVAVRVPGHARARAVIAAFGRPVVAPSANRSGRPSPTTFADAVEETGAFAAALIDGGDCAVGVESTVLSVLDGRVSLLRPGSVTREEIEAVVGPLARFGSGDGEGHRSPGRMALHYAPDAPVRIEVVAANPRRNPARLRPGGRRPALEPEPVRRPARGGGQSVPPITRGGPRAAVGDRGVADTGAGARRGDQ